MKYYLAYIAFFTGHFTLSIRLSKKIYIPGIWLGEAAMIYLAGIILFLVCVGFWLIGVGRETIEIEKRLSIEWEKMNMPEV